MFGDTLNLRHPRSLFSTSLRAILVTLDSHDAIALFCQLPSQMSNASSNVHDLLRRDPVKVGHLFEVDYQCIELMVLLRRTAVSWFFRPLRSWLGHILVISNGKHECLPPLALPIDRLTVGP